MFEHSLLQAGHQAVTGMSYICGRTDPDGSPGEVVAEVELLDVDAVGDETLQLNSVHSDGVREHDQLFTLNMYTYEKNMWRHIRLHTQCQ